MRVRKQTNEKGYTLIPGKLKFQGSIPVVLHNNIKWVVGTAKLSLEGDDIGIDITFYRKGNGTFTRQQIDEVVMACKSGGLKPNLTLRCTPEEVARIQYTKQLDRSEVVAVSLDFSWGSQ